MSPPPTGLLSWILFQFKLLERELLRLPTAADEEGAIGVAVGDGDVRFSVFLTEVGTVPAAVVVVAELVAVLSVGSSVACRANFGSPISSSPLPSGGESVSSRGCSSAGDSSATISGMGVLVGLGPAGRFSTLLSMVLMFSGFLSRRDILSGLTRPSTLGWKNEALDSCRASLLRAGSVWERSCSMVGGRRETG